MIIVYGIGCLVNIGIWSRGGYQAVKAVDIKTPNGGNASIGSVSDLDRVVLFLDDLSQEAAEEFSCAGG